MKNIVLLIKTLNKNMEMSAPEQKKKASIYQMLGTLTMFLIMIPCCVIVGAFVYFLTEALIETGGNGQGLEMIVQLLSAFGVIFTVMVVFNVLYFSSDLDHLLAMPIKPGDLVTAKFIHIYFAESVMEFMILFAAMIGYYISAGVTPVSLLTGILGVFLLPVLPLAYCGIFALISMAFFSKVRIFRNIELVAGIFSILFAALFIFSFVQMDSVTVDHFFQNLLEGNNAFLHVMGMVFFTVPWFMKAMTEGNVLYTLLFVFGNAVAFGILFFFGNLLYIRGVQLVSSNTAGKKTVTKDITDSDYDVHMPLGAYVWKEIKILNRTPAYRKYCVVVNVIWPILTCCAFYLQTTEVSLNFIRKRCLAGSNLSPLVLVWLAIFLGFLATALNSVASTTFSRDGQHIEFMKFIPVDYKTQMQAKVIVSFLYSGVPIVLSTLLFGIKFGCTVVMIVLLLVMALAAMALCTYIGIVLDAAHPKIHWEDEYGALRGNINSFFNMAIACMVCAVIFFLGIVLLKFTSIHWIFITELYFVIMAVATFWMRRIAMTVEVTL